MNNNQSEAIPIDRNSSGRPSIPWGDRKVQIVLSGIPQKYYNQALAAATQAVKPFKEAQ